MAILEFPPLEQADEQGLLAVGGDLEISSLLLAYRNGIFPWPLNEKVLAWFAPPQRTLLFLDEFRMPRSLAKERRKSGYDYKISHDFESVIQECSALQNRGTQRGTWITPAITTAYIKLHEAGYAHSIETYFEGKLVGGMYGVSLGKMFAGESMFYRKPNASKLALCHLVEYLRDHNVPWIDCQVTTQLIHHLGAREVPREEFMALLQESLKSAEGIFPAKSAG